MDKKAANSGESDPAVAAVEAALARERALAGAIAQDAAAVSEPLPDPNAQDAEPEPVKKLEMIEDDEAPASPVPIDLKELERTVEALLFAATEPVGVRELARAADSD